MFRIDHPTAVNELFVAPDPPTGQAGTVVTDEWLNAVQEELANVIEGQGLTLSKLDDTQLQQALGLSGAITPGGFRNRLINSEFFVNQRFGFFSSSMTLAAATDEYTADRWFCSAGGAAGSADIDTFRIDVDEVDEVNGARHALRWDQTVNGDAQPYLEQRIESVRSIADTDVVVTFRARVTAGSAVVGLKAIQNFGTGGGSAEVETDHAETRTLTSSWAEYTFTLNIPGITGKTINSASGDYLAMRLELPSGSTYTVEITAVNLVVGNANLGHERIDPAVEVMRCQRYYESSEWGIENSASLGDDGATFGNQPAVTSAYALQTRFAVTKRTTSPTITWYSTGVGNAAANIDEVTWNGNDIAVNSNEKESEQSTGYPVLASTEASPQIEAHWVADAEL